MNPTGENPGTSACAGKALHKVVCESEKHAKRYQMMVMVLGGWDIKKAHIKLLNYNTTKNKTTF